MIIKVTVDSTNDLTEELLKKYDIRVAPLTINMGDRAYRDMVDITPDDIYRHVDAGGKLPKTSAVNITEYRELFEERLKHCDAVIHINIAGGMSACHQNAMLAAEGLNVFPIDSLNLSNGSAHLALMACDLAEKGVAPEEIVRLLNEERPRIDASFIISRLDYLSKGGRCSPVMALGANILKLRPCIEVHGGVMGVGKKYRGPFDKCVDAYAKDRLANPETIDTRRAFLVHSGLPAETVERIRQMMLAAAPFEEILVTRAGCTISSHCGDGTLGIMLARKCDI